MFPGNDLPGRCGKAGEMRCRRRRSGEIAVQEPLAIVGAVAVVAIDPDGFAARILGDEVIATDITAIPPARFDALGTIAQNPWRGFELGCQRLCLGNEPERPRRSRTA